MTAAADPTAFSGLALVTGVSIALAPKASQGYPVIWSGAKLAKHPEVNSGGGVTLNSENDLSSRALWVAPHAPLSFNKSISRTVLKGLDGNIYRNFNYYHLVGADRRRHFRYCQLFPMKGAGNT